MTNCSLAFDTIKDQYDIDTLREIFEHGCSSGVATNHIYYYQTTKFFDQYEDEIVDYLSDNFGDEFLVNMFKESNADLTSYKNDMCWAYIECIAGQIVEEYENTTIEYEQEVEDYYGKDFLQSMHETNKSVIENVMFGAAT
tara:strand:- start:149 stop:571 length:423 start_codon:yes stop_codon:yes gene_type:complete